MKNCLISFPRLHKKYFIAALSGVCVPVTKVPPIKVWLLASILKLVDAEER
jgi:hypothetical protein